MYLSVAEVQPVKHRKKGPFKVSGSCSTGSATLMNAVSITNGVGFVPRPIFFYSSVCVGNNIRKWKSGETYCECKWKSKMRGLGT